MNANGQPPPIPQDSMKAVKARVDCLLESQGRTHEQLWRAIGMTESGYFRMWKREGVRTTRLHAIARELSVPVSDLMSDPPSSYEANRTQLPPVRPRYLEQRVEQLERQVQELLSLVHAKS